MSFIEDWKALEPQKRYLMIGLLAAGGLGIIIKSMVAPSGRPTSAMEATTPNPQTGLVNPKDPAFAATTVLPQSPRNQGLETVVQSQQTLNDTLKDLASRVDGMEQIIKARNGTMTPAQSTNQAAANSPSTASQAALDRNLPDSPGPVKFEQPTQSRQAGQDGRRLPEFRAGESASTEADGLAAASPRRTRGMVEMLPDDSQKTDSGSDTITLAVPVNSGIDAVVMSGFNATSAGGITGQAGSIISSNSVGVPFVTKLKGDVILPNGFRISDLGECLLGGTAVAKMNAERAMATAESLSCVKPNGEIWEAKVKAYALDNDGTNGIAGKVVSKQGSVLMQAAITGMASGLGAALSPTAIGAVNTNATAGSTTGFQLPNLGAVGYTMVGQGLSNATSQLSKFYLQYASEVMPVVEVTSGTRVTWIFRETIELHRSTVTSKKGK